MGVFRVLFFLTLVSASSQLFAAPQTDYEPSKIKSADKSPRNQEEIVASRKRGGFVSDFNIESGLTNGFFYEKSSLKSVFYIGASKEIEKKYQTWVLAGQVGSAGHAFLKLGRQWDWGQTDQAYQLKPRVFLVNNIEVSQYFASLINFNHYKIEANLLVKNIYEEDSRVHAEVALGYGLNGYNYSLGLSYSF